MPPRCNFYGVIIVPTYLFLCLRSFQPVTRVTRTTLGTFTQHLAAIYDRDHSALLVWIVVYRWRDCKCISSPTCKGRPRTSFCWLYGSRVVLSAWLHFSADSFRILLLEINASSAQCSGCTCSNNQLPAVVILSSCSTLSVLFLAFHCSLSFFIVPCVSRHAGLITSNNTIHGVGTPPLHYRNLGRSEVVFYYYSLVGRTIHIMTNM